MRRFLGASFVGAFYMGPYHKMWFLHFHPWLLSKYLPRVMPGLFAAKLSRNWSKVRFCLTSTFVECWIMSWPNDTAYIFLTEMIESGYKTKQSIQAVKDQLVPTIKHHLPFYSVGLNAVYLVPEKLRPAFDCTVDMGWGMLISWIKNNKFRDETGILSAIADLTGEHEDCRYGLQEDIYKGEKGAAGAK